MTQKRTFAAAIVVANSTEKTGAFIQKAPVQTGKDINRALETTRQDVIPKVTKLKLVVKVEGRKKIKLPLSLNYLFSTASPMLASVFTNPFDVSKTRMQLQGELAKAGQAKVYKNTFDCLWKTATTEGMKGLQRGLPTQLAREGVSNFFKLGMYEPILHAIHDEESGPAPIYKRMIAGWASGITGALACNPLEIVKTRMQSKSAATLAVGTQHTYSGTVDALRGIVKEAGVKGLWKGAGVACLRSAVGMSTYLTSFTVLKEEVIKREWMRDSTETDMLCAMIASFISTACLNPVDVVRMRLYNQTYSTDGVGKLYATAGDAVLKILAKEGPGAFFKGFTANYAFRGPQYVINFSILEASKRFARKQLKLAERAKELEGVFAAHDPGSGLLDVRTAVNAYLAFRPKPDFLKVSNGEYKSLVTSAIVRSGFANGVGLDKMEFVEASKAVDSVIRVRATNDLFSSLDVDHDGALSTSDLARAVGLVAPKTLQPAYVQHEEYQFLVDKAVTKMMNRAKQQAVTRDRFQSIVGEQDDLSREKVLANWIKTAGVSVE